VWFLGSRADILVYGAVQGVGFRPFVYRLAMMLGLKGYVRNLGNGSVKIVVEGNKREIEKFIRYLREKKPPAARYTRFQVKWGNATGAFDDFQILKSKVSDTFSEYSYIPPDIAICDDCIRELLDPSDRRYNYPLIACSHCGPRFTIICDFPYDRDRTTMVDFPMCPTCRREYEDPANRRFHAQVIACPACGPKMTLYNKDGEAIECSDPVAEAARLILEGYIVAIKGVGGIHLAAKTTDDDIVLKLRKRRRRPSQPFAVMSPDVDAVKKYAEVTPLEEELLKSFRRPIVLLKKREDFCLSEWVSPGLHTIGVMLPYTGIHILLFKHIREEPAVIMTSGNYPGEPMVIDNDEAFIRLGRVADYFLLHNRRIFQRCDDSVIRVVDNSVRIIRRSRGYVLEPIEIPFSSPNIVLATGPELRVTGAIIKGAKCYPTQHIGDVDKLESLEFLRSALVHLLRVLKVPKVNVVACDLHPLFLTTRLASELCEEMRCEVIRVQHHHAHMASLMVDSGVNIDEHVVCITADGVGYGTDGNAWGGEILLGGYDGFERVAHLEEHLMPGGDLAVKYPARMAAGILSKVLSREELIEFLMKRCLDGFERGSLEIQFVVKQIYDRINVAKTTSTGRFLDAVAAILGICFKRTYEGEPAMKLEAVAARAKGLPQMCSAKIVDDVINYKRNGVVEIKTSTILENILEGLNKQKSEELAFFAHYVIARAFARVAVEVAKENGVGKVGFTGGVAYNEIISRIIREEVEKEGLKFLPHNGVPPGDAGVSIGQGVIAAVLYKK